MYQIEKITKLLLVNILLILILSACSSPTPMIIEITREVPATVIVTQIITQVVTPEPTPTLPPTPTSTSVPVVKDPQAYIPLENCPQSFVKRGFNVMISLDGGSNAIRPYPDLSSANIIGYAIPGEVVKVIGGPICSFGWLVWQIETEYGLQGWTPETNGDKWWLIPVIQVITP